MEIPKKVRVLCITYEIVVSDDEELWTLDGALDKADNYFGQTRHEDQKVLLHPAMALDMQRETLMHEIFHCALLQTNHTLESEEEERIVRAVSPIILDTLQRPENKEVTQFLLGENATVQSPYGAHN